MKYYTLIVRLEGALSDAVALEWTSHAAPLDSGEGWEPCLRRADGTWRFSSRAELAHRRGPGVFADIAIRYRLSAAGPWSAPSPNRKEIVIVEVIDDDDVLIQPTVLLAPSLIGAAVIGAELAVDPGLWSGFPAPAFAFQWRRDGSDIPGAVARAYAPVPADDRCELACAVTARNLAGEAVVATAALRASYPAPVALGDLPEEVFDEGAEPELVDASIAFAGADLSFAAVGAPIDPRSGVVSVPTHTPVAGATVTITATNSGGAAAVRLPYTVEAAPEVEAPPALAASGVALRGVWRPAGQTTVFTPVVSFPGLAGATAEAIEWTTSGLEVPLENHWELVLPQAGAAGQHELYMRDPAKRDPLASPKLDYAVFGASDAEAERARRLRFRWRRAAAEPWSAASDYVVAPPPVTEATEEWRPMYGRRADALGARQADMPGYFDGGEYFGDGVQTSHSFARSGDTILQLGDTQGLRRSLDGGRTWHYPRAEGLRAMIGHSVGIDPGDPNRVIVVAGVANLTNSGANGVYLSTDGCETFTPVQALTREHCIENPRHAVNVLCCRPGGAPSTRVWRFISWCEAQIGGAVRDALLWTSANGGATWTSQALPAAFNRDRIVHLVQHPTEGGTLFACTEAGVFRTSNDGGAWAPLGAGAITGFPRTLWVDPDAPSRMLVSTSGGTGVSGVFFFNGTAWSKVLGTGVSLGSMAVGPKDGSNRRTIYVASDAGGDGTPSSHLTWQQHWLTTGAPSATKHTTNAATIGPDSPPVGAWFQPRFVPKLANDPSGHLSRLCGRLQSYFVPDMNDANGCAMMGNNVCWRTEDRGRSWVWSDTGRGGVVVQSFGISETNPAKAAMGLNDKQMYVTDAFPLAFVHTPLSSAQKNELRDLGVTQPFIGRATVILPGAAPAGVAFPAARRSRVVSSIGSYQGQQVIVSRQDGGSNWSLRHLGVGNYTFMDYSRQNPNVVYCGDRRSDDGGETWPVGLGRRIVGMSRSDGSIVYGSSNQTAIFKSTNGGATWSGAPWLTLGVDGNDEQSCMRFWPSPHDHAKVVTVGPDHDLMYAAGNASATVTIGLGLKNVWPAPHRQPAPNWLNVVWCPLEPRRIYAACMIIGTKRVFRGMFSADYASIEWTDLTLNYPRTSKPRRLFALPTGEIILTGNAGSFMISPPGVAPAASPWRLLPRPLPNDRRP
jgi:hypothetical protein